MAEPLKRFFSRALVARIAAAIARVHPTFDARAFTREASRGLEGLELLARARRISEALAAHLPARYEDAIDVILRSLGPEITKDELVGAGMEPFFYLPHTMFVASRGLEHFELSMRAQHELTRRFTCEWSIRAFLERHPERTLEALVTFARDPNPHVRRLASEGTRPRLPWAPRVQYLDERPALEILELLKHDPTTLVRRSVANHLNDLSKTRPELVREIAARWLNHGVSRDLVSHALRALVKRGDARALALLGFAAAEDTHVSDVVIAPKRVKIGGRARVSFVVSSREARAIAVDLIVHFKRASRKTSPKVFKVARLSLRAGERVTLAKSVSLAQHTTRTPNAGRHVVEAMINGQKFSLGSFTVTR